MSKYATWSLEKLKKESSEISKAIKERESQDKKIALAELKSLAKKHGFTLSDLLKETTPKKRNSTKTNGISRKAISSTSGKNNLRRAKARVKYRNPANEEDTWTGRGRQPRWVVSHIKNGGTMDDLTI